MSRTCSIDGCEKNVVAIGYCDMHYRRFKRGDDLNAPPKGSTPHNHAGARFGRWVVVSRAPNKGMRTAWFCKCDCGTETSVFTSHLVSGRSVSCGCYKSEVTSQALKTHGLTDSDEHRIWCLMKSRCNNTANPSYPDYGGRGITVCDKWNDFVNFYSDMGPRPSKQHSIGRIENDKGYSPDNCRWETPKQQANNTRRNKYYTIEGTRRTLSEICEANGLNYGTVKWRLRNGWTVEESLK